MEISEKENHARWMRIAFAEAEKALEHFYTLYKDEIASCVDISRFNSFKRLLYKQIEEFFENKKNSKTKQDFGFFTEAIRKMRQQKST